MTVEDDSKNVETLQTSTEQFLLPWKRTKQKKFKADIGKSKPYVREKISKKHRLKKYGRKTAEDWTKKFNEAFNKLRKNPTK